MAPTVPPGATRAGGGRAAQRSGGPGVESRARRCAEHGHHDRVGRGRREHQPHGLRADLPERQPHRGERGGHVPQRLDAVEPGDGEVARHVDARVARGRQRTDRHDVVQREHHLDVAPVGEQPVHRLVGAVTAQR